MHLLPTYRVEHQLLYSSSCCTISRTNVSYMGLQDQHAPLSNLECRFSLNLHALQVNSLYCLKSCAKLEIGTVATCLAPTCHCLEQCRLSSAIRAQHQNALPALNCERDAPQQWLSITGLAPTQRYVLGMSQGPPVSPKPSCTQSAHICLVWVAVAS